MLRAFTASSLIAFSLLGLASGCAATRSSAAPTIHLRGDQVVRDAGRYDDFADGCRVKIDALAQVLHRDGQATVYELVGSDGFEVGVATHGRASLSVAPARQIAASEGGGGADWCATGDTHCASTTAADMRTSRAVTMESTGASMQLSGQLTCGNGTVSFDWLFDHTVDEALEVTAASAGAIHYVVSPDRLFCTDAACAERGGERFVAADADRDGELTLPELGAARAEAAEGDIVTLGDVIWQRVARLGTLSTDG